MEAQVKSIGLRIVNDLCESVNLGRALILVYRICELWNDDRGIE